MSASSTGPYITATAFAAVPVSPAEQADREAKKRAIHEAEIADRLERYSAAQLDHVWAVQTGSYDDVETPRKISFDDGRYPPRPAA